MTPSCDSPQGGRKLPRAVWGVIGWLLGAVSALGMWACDSNRSQPTAAGSDPTVPVWELAKTPDFKRSSGELGGDTIPFFRVLRGTIAPNGDLVITLGGGQNRIVYLDSAGGVVGFHGGPGSGPGEFRNISGISTVGDQTAVWDLRNLRVTLFSGRDRVGEFPLQIPPLHRVVGMFEDRTIVTTPSTARPAEISRQANVASGWESDAPAVGEERTYYLWSQANGSLGMLTGPLEPPSASIRLEVPRDGRSVGVGSPFGSSCLPETKHVVTDDGLFTAESQNGVLYHLDRSGARTPLYSSTFRGTVTAEAVKAIEQWMDAVEWASGKATLASKRSARDRIGRVGDPLPSFWSAMIPDLEGGVWLRRASCFSSDPNETWEVVGRGGGLAAIVELPSNLKVLSVRGGRLLGVVKDELGVEYVVVFRIRR